MNNKKIAKLMTLAALASLTLSACRGGESPSTKAEPSIAPSPVDQGVSTTGFKQARLIVEINATDGDAGLQLFLDHEPWQTVSLFHPDGSKILDVINQGVLKDYGLTELFSESSEPSFDKFPLEEFKKLFPAGRYKLVGTTIEGKAIETLVTLSHDSPKGPEILSPKEDSEVGASDVTVSWKTVTEPPRIEIIGYQVLVVREEPVLRTFSADLPATATKIRVPTEFLEAGAEYKVEVLAIEKNRNQTLSEISFRVS